MYAENYKMKLAVVMGTLHIKIIIVVTAVYYLDVSRDEEKCICHLHLLL